MSVSLKQGAAKRRAPGRDLWWGPELKVSRKYWENIYIRCPHPHKPEPGGMGHMEQGHSELFWVTTALQLTPGMVI